MSRKGWEALSVAQRRRYERAGVNRADYDSGFSLAAARGHAKTPERPVRAEVNPERYRGYLRRHAPGMRVVSTRGVVEVEGLSQRERSLVGKHDNAVRSFLDATGIPSPYKSKLADFDGKTVRGYAPGSDDLETFDLETREPALERREGRGQLRFESIYPSKGT